MYCLVKYLTNGNQINQGEVVNNNPHDRASEIIMNDSNIGKVDIFKLVTKETLQITREIKAYNNEQREIDINTKEVILEAPDLSATK